jgi:hypothetical protein
VKIRETLRENQALGIGVSIAALLLIGGMAWSMFGRLAEQVSMASELYFTEDDGKTLFVDDSANIAPFLRNGKEAVQAGVFQCNGKSPFVGYLLRYAEAGRKELMKLSEAERRSTAANVIKLRQKYGQVKRPGESKWQLIEDEQSVGIGDIMTPPCPDGGGHTPRIVHP